MAQFDDGKDQDALRTIGEVAKATGIKAHVLRYWEQQFPMLKPLTRSGGRRYYRPEDIELIERIDRLVNREGYTLKGAKAALRETPDPQAAAQAPAAPTPAADHAELVGKLMAIRDDLKAALAA
ncbi:MAG: MerR family transcriptional regulator [Pseudomonadota bacterium]|nr:MerR family transcriptional regulator [Pseudomonadota bacterium]